MRIHFAAAALSLAALFGPGDADAQATVERIKLGVLTDFSGSAADATGTGSFVAAQLAVEDYGRKLLGDIPIEIIKADHQSKPDIASATARKWLDVEGVNAILDTTFSSAALAVNEVVRGSKGVFLPSGAGTTELTGAKCSPNTVHWTYDTYSTANGTASALLKRGLKSWFFITSDYAFGRSLEADATRIIKANGGEVLGAVRHPSYTNDVTSFVLQAMNSKANVVGLANSVTDTQTSVKQFQELGLEPNGPQHLAALLMLLTDVHSLGLKAAQGLYLTEAFYWDMNEGTRAFSDRFAARMKGARPTMLQAGVYSAVAHYLKSVKAIGSTDGEAVIREMKKMPVSDPLFGDGYVREDGRNMHDMYLFQVKTPAESKGEWDLYNLLARIPAEAAFRPLSESTCPMVKQ
ncbi:ABC transporter substrate-binding protein [Xanthobacter oligotrophicus]|uniref:ABC transporter substrate-binding protein n=1 Tax=Xanthobacter oligotrophicus TaxID=2607286 RepID=A0ABW7A2V8_9HYPH